MRFKLGRQSEADERYSLLSWSSLSLRKAPAPGASGMGFLGDSALYPEVWAQDSHSSRPSPPRQSPSHNWKNQTEAHEEELYILVFGVSFLAPPLHPTTLWAPRKACGGASSRVWKSLCLPVPRSHTHTVPSLAFSSLLTIWAKLSLPASVATLLSPRVLQVNQGLSLISLEMWV